jgi:hypothetical protein
MSQCAHLHPKNDEMTFFEFCGGKFPAVALPVEALMPTRAACYIKHCDLDFCAISKNKLDRRDWRAYGTAAHRLYDSRFYNRESLSFDMCVIRSSP